MEEVEKVIEDLCIMKRHTFRVDDCESVDNAIQTIRELQSKSEEVCEWKMPNDNADVWTPSCEPNSNYNVFGVAWFNHCPYCGGKIKVVE